jgi:hypothetical protein
MANLVYILGASHSGSTLLAMLLGAHPQACTTGELKLSPQAIGDIERYRCSCGEPIRKCGFWQEVAAGMAQRGVEFDLADAGTDYRGIDSRYARRLLRLAHRGPILESLRDLGLCVSPAWRRWLPRAQRRNAALVATICEISGARHVVDSSKIASRLKYLLRNQELNVRVVHIVRDGRAVALTYVDPATFADARDPALRGGGGGGDRADERLSMARAAAEWKSANLQARCILAHLDRSRWIEIRYEDLCTQTDATLERVFHFLGLDPARRPADFRSVGNHVIGNGMRLDSSSEIRLDERWRTVLTDGDLAVFDRVAGEMNRRYGYAKDAAAASR